jgi:hypothetical protein
LLYITGARNFSMAPLSDHSPWERRGASLPELVNSTFAEYWQAGSLRSRGV